MQLMKNGMMQISEENVDYQIRRFKELMEMMGEPVRVPATGLDIEDLFLNMGRSINSREVIVPVKPGSWDAVALGKKEVADTYFLNGAEFFNGDLEVCGWHPVFSMTEHFRGNDSGNLGYTKNYYRGDHISIPIYSEAGWEIYVLEISFHKGSTIIEIIGYPDRPLEVARELHDMLLEYETR